MRVSPPRESRRAFTLTELLVVVGIMALMASMTVVAVAPMLKGHSLRSGASVVKGLLQQVRSYAVNRRQPTRIVFEVDEGRMIVESHAIEDGWAEAGRVDKPRFLPKGVNFKEFDDAGGQPVVVTLADAKLDQDPYEPTGVADELEFEAEGYLSDDNAWGNSRIHLVDKGGSRMKVIEVVFSSGLTRTYDVDLGED